MKKSTKTILIVVLCVLVIAGIIGGYVGYNLTYHPSKWLAEGDDAVEESAGEVSPQRPRRRGMGIPPEAAGTLDGEP